LYNRSGGFHKKIQGTESLDVALRQTRLAKNIARELIAFV
jgi:hypothetical protein